MATHNKETSQNIIRSGSNEALSIRCCLGARRAFRYLFGLCLGATYTIVFYYSTVYSISPLKWRVLETTRASCP